MFENDTQEKFDLAFEGLKEKPIPESNQMGFDLFMGYGYERLRGNKKDEAFISQYISKFGVHNGVELYDSEQKLVMTLPPLAKPGKLSNTEPLVKHNERYVNANNRMAGLGNHKVSPELDALSLKPTDDPWLEVDKRYNELMNNDEAKESLEAKTEDVMEWD